MTVLQSARSRREHVVDVDLPGLQADELGVTLRGHVVSIRVDGLVRSFRLPDDVDTSGLRATYSGGVLHLRAPTARATSRIVPIAGATACVHPDAAPI
jgi:HSP20 family molecular chaperone IbpA